MIPLVGNEEVHTQKVEENETRILFQASDVKSIKTSGDSYRHNHDGLGPMPFWRGKLRTRTSFIGLLVVSFVGIVVVVVAISVPLAVKARTEWNVTPSKTEGFSSTNAAMSSPSNQTLMTTFSPTTTDMVTYPDEVSVLVARGWLAVHHSGNFYLYKISSDKATYQNATKRCVSAGSTLAAVGLRIQQVRDKLFQVMVFPVGVRIFIGLDDLDSRHTWKWIDGVVSTNSNTAWAPNEPNDNLERCGEVERSRLFAVNDIDCKANLNYLCEKIF